MPKRGHLPPPNGRWRVDPVNHEYLPLYEKAGGMQEQFEAALAAFRAKGLAEDLQAKAINPNCIAGVTGRGPARKFPGATSRLDFTSAGQLHECPPRESPRPGHLEQRMDFAALGFARGLLQDSSVCHHRGGRRRLRAGHS